MLSEAEVKAAFPQARVMESGDVRVWYTRPSRAQFRRYKPAAMLIGQLEQVPVGRMVEVQDAHLDALEQLAKDCTRSHTPAELDQLLEDHPMLLEQIGSQCVVWMSAGVDPKGSSPQPSTSR